MTDIIKDGLGFNLTVLKILQLSADLKKQTKLDRWCTYLVYVSTCLHMPVLGGLYFLLEEDFQSDHVGTDGLTVATATYYSLKIFSYIRNRDGIVNSIRFLNQIKVNLNEKQRGIVGESVRICKRNSYAYLTVVSSGLVFWAVKPILLSTPQLPANIIWPPVDTASQGITFWFLYFYLNLGACYLSIAVSAIIPLVASLMCLASGYLRVLKDNLEFLDEYAEGELSKFEHRTLSNFTKEIEQCCSQIIFCQFCGSVFSICFCCYMLSTLTASSTEFFSIINYLFIVPTQLYFYCYYGTELFEESEGVTNAIYMGQWYNYDVRLRKSLLVILERSQRPITITAGNIFELSLESFTTILRRSYSLLAVLKNQK